MDVESQESLKLKKTRIISTILSPALRLWLRSQVERVEALEFNITGGDRQILQGNIPAISIAASSAVYQGLHLSKIQLEATGIRINLGQVIKGKPLRLLSPVPVWGQLRVTESDFQSSLKSPLLSSALTEFLTSLLISDQQISIDHNLTDKQLSFSWQTMAINLGQLTLTGMITKGTLAPTPIIIGAGLQLASPHELRLNPFQIQMLPDLEPQNLDGFEVDLGADVDIQELSLTPGQLICLGRLTVLP